tara:strand:- start:39 stop:563 length:525 start_codon:yes stop_codon:yes gene_type:complete
MNKCKQCNIEIDDHRYHLGYTECVECSNEEKYSAHTVYPHKTGGYVQPIKKNQSDNLKRLDRRSVGGSGKPAKGIMKDNSWDRWLKQYELNKNKPKPRRVVWKTPTISYISMSEAESLVQDFYNSRGYQPTLDYCMELYKQDKISFGMKNSLTNMITNQQMLPKKLRKWTQRIK